MNHMYLMLCSIDYSSDMIVGKCYCGLTKMTTLIHTFFLLQTVKSIYLGVTSLVFEQRFQSLHLHFSYNTWSQNSHTLIQKIFIGPQSYVGDFIIVTDLRFW